MEVVPEIPGISLEEKGNPSYMKRKLDTVLSEGNMRLPYPSMTDNINEGKMAWSPNPLSKKMPVIDGQSPPQINCMTNSNNTMSNSISPGVT